MSDLFSALSGSGGAEEPDDGAPDGDRARPALVSVRSERALLFSKSGRRLSPSAQVQGRKRSREETLSPAKRQSSLPANVILHCIMSIASANVRLRDVTRVRPRTRAEPQHLLAARRCRADLPVRCHLHDHRSCLPDRLDPGYRRRLLHRSMHAEN